GRVRVSKSTVMAAPPIGHVWGRLPYAVPPNGAMYTERSTLAFQSTTLLTGCTPSGVLLIRGETTMATAQPAGRSRRRSARSDPDRRDNPVSPRPNPLPPDR